MTDYRALCAELADALHNAIRVINCEDGTLHISTAEPVLDRARAALAEPEEEEEEDPYTEILDHYAAMAARHTGCVFHQ